MMSRWAGPRAKDGKAEGDGRLQGSSGSLPGDACVVIVWVPYLLSWIIFIFLECRILMGQIYIKYPIQ